MASGGRSDVLGRVTRPALYACFVLSGVAGLVYEVCWGSVLGQLVGGTTATHTVVLAAFMGGLALGNRFGGRWADRAGSLLRTYAALEAVVGVLGVLSPTLADAAGAIYLALAPDPDGAVWLDLPLRLSLAVATVLPAAVAMGATLPVLVRACTERLQGLGSSVGWLYFINSAGATAGAFAAGFLLIPDLGLELSMVLAGMLNLALAAVTLGLAQFEEAGVAAAEAAGARRYTPRQVGAALAAVTISGVATMIIEVVWTRVLSLTMGGSAHAFSIMLTTFIAGIALGGVVAARVARDDRDAYGPLLLAEAIAGLSLLALLPWYDHLPLIFHGAASLIARHEAAYPLYLGVCTAVAVLAMLIPTVAMGATLPLASRVATSALGRAGRTVGGVFSWNTVGNVVGAALGGLLLVPTVGLEWTMRVGVLVLLAASVRLAWGFEDWRLRRWLAGVGVLAMLGAAGTPGWSPLLMHSGLYRSLGTEVGSFSEFEAAAGKVEFLFAEDDAEATTSVVENTLGHRLLRINGKSDASNHGDVPNQVLAGQLPALLHGAPKNALVVGLGSGITVGSVLTHEVERVDVVEIAPSVVRASRYFDPWNGAALDDPRVHVYERDARSLLKLAPPERLYDVVVSEPSNPWQAGSAMLFTEEYYRLVESRLAPGGVVCLWVHMYEMNDEVLQIILRTIATVFPRAHVFNSRGNDLVLITGREELTPDLARVQELMTAPAIAADLARATPDGRAMGMLELLGLELMGPAGFAKRWGAADIIPVHNDRFPVLQYRAPRAFFVGASARLFEGLDVRVQPSAREDVLLGRWLGDRVLTVDERERLAEFFALRGRTLDRVVADALAVELWASQRENARAVDRLMELQLEPVLAREARRRLVGDDSTEAGCRAGLEHEADLFIRGASVFHLGETTEFDALRGRCVEAHPALAPLGEKLARRVQRAKRVGRHASYGVP